MSDRAAFVERYGDLFEHSPWVAEAAYDRGPFQTKEQLLEALTAAMYAAPQERHVELIRAHPDLAGKAKLTTDSAREQSSAGLDQLTSDEYERFNRANTAYRERFGFPFVICAREHDKESILASAEARLQNDREHEIGNALAEIAKIAALRLEDR
jgi:OHCU decarboxylase